MSLHVYSAACSWSGPIHNASTITGLSIPCCPHCGSVLYQIEEEKWKSQMAAHVKKGHENYAELIEWSERQNRCYPTLREAGAAFEKQGGKKVVWDLPEAIE